MWLASEVGKMDPGDPEQYLERLMSNEGKQPVDADGKFVELRLPPWFDANLFRKSQKLYKKHLAVIFSGMLLGLISILAIPTILKVLICTRKSGTPMDAYRRYVKTIYHVIAWNVHELKPGSKSWQSIEMVRKKHYSSRKMCENAANLTILQRDMALTQFGFMGYIVLSPEMLGVHDDTAEFLNAYVHFWRVIGFMLGIKDEFNLCTDSWSTTRCRLRIVRDKIFKPTLEKADSDFDRMTESLINGLWYYNWHLDVKSILFVTKRIAGCEHYEYFDSDFRGSPSTASVRKMQYNELSRYQKFNVIMFIYSHETALKYQLVRHFLNFQVYLSQLISFYIPFLAILFFGFKKAYVRIFHGNRKDRKVH